MEFNMHDQTGSADENSSGKPRGKELPPQNPPNPFTELGSSHSGGLQLLTCGSPSIPSYQDSVNRGSWEEAGKNTRRPFHEWRQMLETARAVATDCAG